MNPLGNEVDGLAQVFVGAMKKSRRCFPKESTILFKRSDDAKRKQSIYSQISFNCYAVGDSNTGQKTSLFLLRPTSFF